MMKHCHSSTSHSSSHSSSQSSYQSAECTLPVPKPLNHDLRRASRSATGSTARIWLDRQGRRESRHNRFEWPSQSVQSVQSSQSVQSVQSDLPAQSSQTTLSSQYSWQGSRKASRLESFLEHRIGSLVGFPPDKQDILSVQSTQDTQDTHRNQSFQHNQTFQDSQRLQDNESIHSSQSHPITQAIRGRQTSQTRGKINHRRRRANLRTSNFPNSYSSSHSTNNSHDDPQNGQNNQHQRSKDENDDHDRQSQFRQHYWHHSHSPHPQKSQRQQNHHQKHFESQRSRQQPQQHHLQTKVMHQINDTDANINTYSNASLSTTRTNIDANRNINRHSLQFGDFPLDEASIRETIFDASSFIAAYVAGFLSLIISFTNYGVEFIGNFFMEVIMAPVYSVLSQFWNIFPWKTTIVRCLTGSWNCLDCLAWCFCCRRHRHDHCGNSYPEHALPQRYYDHNRRRRCGCCNYHLDVQSWMEDMYTLYTTFCDLKNKKDVLAKAHHTPKTKDHCNDAVDVVGRALDHCQASAISAATGLSGFNNDGRTCNDSYCYYHHYSPSSLISNNQVYYNGYGNRTQIVHNISDGYGVDNNINSSDSLCPQSFQQYAPHLHDHLLQHHHQPHSIQHFYSQQNNSIFQPRVQPPVMMTMSQRHSLPEDAPTDTLSTFNKSPLSHTASIPAGATKIIFPNEVLPTRHSNSFSNDFPNALPNPSPNSSPNTLPKVHFNPILNAVPSIPTNMTPNLQMNNFSNAHTDIPPHGPINNFTNAQAHVPSNGPINNFTNAHSNMPPNELMNNCTKAHTDMPPNGPMNNCTNAHTNIPLHGPMNNCTDAHSNMPPNGPINNLPTIHPNTNFYASPNTIPHALPKTSDAFYRTFPPRTTYACPTLPNRLPNTLPSIPSSTLPNTAYHQHHDIHNHSLIQQQLFQQRLQEEQMKSTIQQQQQ